MLVLAGLTTLVSVPFAVSLDVSGFSGQSFSRFATSTPYLAANAIGAVASLLLVIAIAALADHRGTSGRRLGPVPIVAGLVANLAGFYNYAWHLFVAPIVATGAPQVLDGGPPSGLAMVGVFGSLAISVVGMVILAVAAMRARVFPGPAAVLIVLASLAFVLGTVSAVLLGIGLLWAGAAGLRADRRCSSRRPKRIMFAMTISDAGRRRLVTAAAALLAVQSSGWRRSCSSSRRRRSRRSPTPGGARSRPC